MRLTSAIRSEVQKVRHTPMWVIHVLLPLLGAALFTLYFLLYGNVDPTKKLKLILELTIMVFPLLIAIISGLNISLEEKAAHFQTMLAATDRGELFFAKLLTLYGAGVAALIGLFVLFLLGSLCIGQIGAIPISLLVCSVAGIAVWNLVIYTLHLFLGFQFGLGASLFWGVFESLQCILYSNIELQGMARFIPFAWPVEWVHDILNGTLTEHGMMWGAAALLTILFCTVIIRWFTQWEGRKNAE